MSTKIIGAIIVVGAAAATLPFYLSGHFTHQALNNQLTEISSLNEAEFAVKNIASDLGIWSSQFSYDFDISIKDDPEFADVREALGSDSVSVTVTNQLQHNFLGVTMDTKFSGEVFEQAKKHFTELTLQKSNEDLPLTTVTTNIKVNLNGSVDMQSIATVQQFSIVSTNEDIAKQGQVSFSPFVISSTWDENNWRGNSTIESITINSPENDVAINMLAFRGNGDLINGVELDAFGKQLFDIKLGSLTLEEAGQVTELLKNMTWHMSSKVKDARTIYGNKIALDEFVLPDQPFSKIAEMNIDFDINADAKAMEAYLKTMQSMSANAQDPEVAVDMISKILAESVNFKVNAIRAKTFAGLIDVNANLDIAAIDPEAFKANPMQLIESLTYAAKGELPLDLLSMTGAVPPEMIDNLVQNEMIEIKDGQLVFTMDGEKGHVNLNGKPLM